MEKEEDLEMVLFARKSGQIYLVAKYLPRLYELIRESLTQAEATAIITLNLQNLLIEKANEKLKSASLQALVDDVLSKIRSEANFWMPMSEIGNSIQEKFESGAKPDHQSLQLYKEYTAAARSLGVPSRIAYVEEPKFELPPCSQSISERADLLELQTFVPHLYSTFKTSDAIFNLALQELILQLLVRKSGLDVDHETAKARIEALLRKFCQNPCQTLTFCKACLLDSCEAHVLSTYKASEKRLAAIRLAQAWREQQLSMTAQPGAEEAGPKLAWTEQDYRLFLEGLLKYFHSQVNNQKIARFMGEDNSRVVKQVKNKYLRVLRIRAEAKQVTRLELLQQDIANFSMEAFKMRKAKKPRRASVSSSEEVIKSYRK